jgi:hypothetical protein
VERPHVKRGPCRSRLRYDAATARPPTVGGRPLNYALDPRQPALRIFELFSRFLFGPDGFPYDARPPESTPGFAPSELSKSRELSPPLPPIAYAGLIALACVTSGWLIIRSNLGAYKQLVARHAVTTARVASVECWDHWRIDYEFRVHGRTFSGQAHPTDKQCEDRKKGEPLLVFYDPSAPEINSASDPLSTYQGQRQVLTIYLVAIGALVIFMISRWIWHVRTFNRRRLDGTN